MINEQSITSSNTDSGQASHLNQEQANVAYHVRKILELLGENPDREGLLDTPDRVAKMFEEMLSGLNVDPISVLNTTFEETSDGPVIVSDITFYSLCEHHMVPFFGKAHIGYLPGKRIVGLSKLARLVETVSQRLQVQERMTSQIVDAVATALQPEGVIALIEAEHTCMCARGVKKPGSRTTTISASGRYRDDFALRQEFLRMIGK